MTNKQAFIETGSIEIVEKGQRGDGRSYDVRLKQRVGISSEVAIIGKTDDGETFSIMIKVIDGVPSMHFIDTGGNKHALNPLVKTWWQ